MAIRRLAMLSLLVLAPSLTNAQSLDEQFRQQTTARKQKYAECLRQWESAQIRKDEWNRLFLKGSTLILVSNGGAGCLNNYRYPYNKTFQESGLQLLFKKEGDNMYLYKRYSSGLVVKEYQGTFRKVEFSGVFEKRPSVNNENIIKPKYEFDCGKQPTREDFNKCMANI